MTGKMKCARAKKKRPIRQKRVIGAQKTARKYSFHDSNKRKETDNWAEAWSCHRLLSSFCTSANSSHSVPAYQKHPQLTFQHTPLSSLWVSRGVCGGGGGSVFAFLHDILIVPLPDTASLLFRKMCTQVVKSRFVGLEWMDSEYRKRGFALLQQEMSPTETCRDAYAIRRGLINFSLLGYVSSVLYFFHFLPLFLQVSTFSLKRRKRSLMNYLRLRQRSLTSLSFPIKPLGPLEIFN